NHDGLTDAGDVVDYQVEVVNTGDVALAVLLLLEFRRVGLLSSGASLAPGHTLDFFPTYTVTQSDVDNPAHSITNVATATATQAEIGRASCRERVSSAEGPAVVKRKT